MCSFLFILLSLMFSVEISGIYHRKLKTHREKGVSKIFLKTIEMI